MLTEERLMELRGQFEKAEAPVPGFVFEYEYPGFFVYSGEKFRVFFTPDFNDDGEIAVQINNQDDDCVEAWGEKYPADITFEWLVNFLKPILQNTKI